MNGIQGKRYNQGVNRLLALLLSAVVLVAGCVTPDVLSRDSEDRFERRERELAEALHKSDPEGNNIRVVVKMLETDTADRLTVDALWTYVDRNVAASGRPGVVAESGLMVGLAGEDFQARFDVARRQLRSSSVTELFVVFADGTYGYINIGTEIPVPQFYYLGRRYSAVEYDFRQAGRSLKVAARKLPSGMIDLEVTPVFSRFLSGRGDMELTEASARVTVRPGQAMVIGGNTSSGGNVASALFGYSSGSRMERSLITLTVYLQ